MGLILDVLTGIFRVDVFNMGRAAGYQEAIHEQEMHLAAMKSRIRRMVK